MDGPDHDGAEVVDVAPADICRGGAAGADDPGSGMAFSLVSVRLVSSAWGRPRGRPVLVEAAIRRDFLVGGIVLFAANNAKH